MKPRNIFTRKNKDPSNHHDLVHRPLDSDSFSKFLHGALRARTRTRGPATSQSPKASSPVRKSSAPGHGSDGPDKLAAQR